MARLEQWRIGQKLVALEDGIALVTVAGGYVSGHDILPDSQGKDDVIVTSPIKEIDQENSPPKWIQTMNTRYELGEPYKAEADPNLN